MGLELKDRLRSLREELDNRKFFNQKCDENIAKISEDCTAHRKKLKTIDLAIKFVDEVAMSRRKKIKEYFEHVVGQALKTVYKQDFFVNLNYATKYNRSVLEIEVGIRYPGGYEVVRSNDGEGFGGGVWDTVATTFRLLVLTLVPSIDNVLILDETYKHQDNERIHNVGLFLKKLSKDMGIQIIYNTHHHSLVEYSDRASRVELDFKTGKSRLVAA